MKRSKFDIYFIFAWVTVMASRAAIEEQIRLLNEQLVASTAYDPEFTPKELVRWNPDLIGTVLHCELTPKIQKNEIYNGPILVFAEVFGIITDTGMLTNTSHTCHESSYLSYAMYDEELCNDFKKMTIYKRINCHLNEDKCKRLNLKYHQEEVPNTGGHMMLHLRLVPEDKNILDYIYVSSIITLPYSHKQQQVIHKYPLSHLYKKWKQERDARKPTASAEPEDPRTKP